MRAQPRLRWTFGWSSLDRSALVRASWRALDHLEQEPRTLWRSSRRGKVWKANLIEKRPTREDERRTLAERANDTKQLYDQLLKNFKLVELELQQSESERDQALKKLETVTRENIQQLERIRAAEPSNVVQFAQQREHCCRHLPNSLIG